MGADFKSHVLLRDEKGFFGIPFKRLLLGGVGGGLTYTLFNIVMPTWAIPAGVVLAIFVLIMTGTRGGLPLGLRHCAPSMVNPHPLENDAIETQAAHPNDRQLAAMTVLFFYGMRVTLM